MLHGALNIWSHTCYQSRKARAGHSRAEAGRVKLSRFRDKRLESSGGDERAMRDHHVSTASCCGRVILALLCACGQLSGDDAVFCRPRPDCDPSATCWRHPATYWRHARHLDDRYLDTWRGGHFCDGYGTRRLHSVRKGDSCSRLRRWATPPERL